MPLLDERRCRLEATVELKPRLGARYKAGAVKHLISSVAASKDKPSLEENGVRFSVLLEVTVEASERFYSDHVDNDLTKVESLEHLHLTTFNVKDPQMNVVNVKEPHQRCRWAARDDWERRDFSFADNVDPVLVKQRREKVPDAADSCKPVIVLALASRPVGAHTHIRRKAQRNRLVTKRGMDVQRFGPIHDELCKVLWISFDVHSAPPERFDKVVAVAVEEAIERARFEDDAVAHIVEKILVRVLLIVASRQCVSSWVTRRRLHLRRNWLCWKGARVTSRPKHPRWNRSSDNS